MAYNLTNPALSMAAIAGITEALSEGRSVPNAAGVAPSAVAGDYAQIANVAVAIGQELDVLLGAGFDVQLATNATPGVSISLTQAAGTASLAPLVKPLTMCRIARAQMAGKGATSLVLADYAGVAAAIKAQYNEWLATVYALAAS